MKHVLVAIENSSGEIFKDAFLENWGEKSDLTIPIITYS